MPKLKNVSVFFSLLPPKFRVFPPNFWVTMPRNKMMLEHKKHFEIKVLTININLPSFASFRVKVPMRLPRRRGQKKVPKGSSRVYVYILYIDNYLYTYIPRLSPYSHCNVSPYFFCFFTTKHPIRPREVLRHFLRGQNALLREAERVLQEDPISNLPGGCGINIH